MEKRAALFTEKGVVPFVPSLSLIARFYSSHPRSAEDSRGDPNGNSVASGASSANVPHACLSPRECQRAFVPAGKSYV